jgi:hypothetical protein
MVPTTVKEHVRVTVSEKPARSRHALKQVSYEGPLVCRKTFTAAEEIEERVTVFDENWAEYFGRVCNCNFAGMLLGTVAAAVIEQHSRKGTRPRWLPEECSADLLTRSPQSSGTLGAVQWR